MTDLFFPRFILSPTHISGLYIFVVSLSSYITVKMQVIVEMVFCFEYCSDLLREKIVLVINKTFSEVTGVSLKFAKVSRSLQQ